MNKLYETDSYLREAKTKITSCVKKEDGIYVSLEDTIFFPTEGGQNADSGFLVFDGRRIRICDGTIVKNGITDDIIYKTDSELPIGAEVTCELDYDIRYDRMQNHSGEHLLTGVIHNTYGYSNVGFHLSDDGPVTLDLNGPVTYEQVIAMEALANSYIYRNMPITDTYPSKEELADLEYRSKIEIDSGLRLITIGNEEETVDVCACCAPHVRFTGEIGIIKVINVINWKGGVRIFMLAGRRALEYINHEHEIVRGLTGLLSTHPDNVIGQVTSHINEINELKGRLNRAIEKGILDGLDTTNERIVFIDSDIPATSMRNVYNYLYENRSGYVGVFAGVDEKGYRFYAGGRNLDARDISSLLREKFSAKGGGKPEMVQGQVEAKKEDIIKALIELFANAQE